MKEKMVSSKTMERQWTKNYGVDVDRWESNGKIERLDYDEEVEKNNGKNIGKIAALMWDQNDAK